MILKMILRLVKSFMNLSPKNLVPMFRLYLSHQILKDQVLYKQLWRNSMQEALLAEVAVKWQKDN